MNAAAMSLEVQSCTILEENFKAIIYLCEIMKKKGKIFKECEDKTYQKGNWSDM